MGAVSELCAMRRSFSGDAVRGIQSRSGDSQSESSAPLFDYVAHVQSAEADIIEEEERAEQAESKREFAALLRAYFKKILTADEYRFLVGCIRQNKTLYQVGRALGVNANKTAESIESKCKASEKQFFLLMSYSGYDCRRGCEFMARLFNPDAHRRKVRDKIQACREYHQKYNKDYRLKHKEYLQQIDRLRYAAQREYFQEKNKKYRSKNREAYRQYMREWKRNHKANRIEERKRYREKYRDKLIEKYKKRRQNRTEEMREKERAYGRARYAAQSREDKDRRNARDRARRARKRAEQTKQEQRENEQANGQGNA